MPELPEVETLRRELTQVLIGREIKSVSILSPKAVAPLSPQQFSARIRNQKIVTINRRAKILLLDLTNDKTLAIHLKMTGQLVYYPQGSTLKPAKVEPLIIGGHPQPLPQGLFLAGSKDSPFNHTRVIFNFTDGSRLYFNDLRKFGWLRLLDSQAIANLYTHHGFEPLSSDFTISAFKQILNRHSKRKIKTLLLDQTLIAGLGNIYVDEACFRARVRPTRRVVTLTTVEKMKLHRAIRAVLTLSIKHGGTSVRNYRRSDGSRGGFAAYLQVYDRTGKPCKNCPPDDEAGHPAIIKIKLAGRGTHYCPQCQK
ncbi:MAG TPA: bifunctional DNA-formamidopyrimidine glycosylase/DNA-(apurinic or apyrimidinic site) lyase [Candidatus Paceibacterota bacterium]